MDTGVSAFTRRAVVERFVPSVDSLWERAQAGPGMADVIVLDTRVLIAYLVSDDDHHAAADKPLAAAVDDDFGSTR